MITLRAPQRDRAVPVAEPRRRPDLRVVARPAGLDDLDLDRDPSRRTASGVVSTLLVLLLFACIFGVVVFQVFLVQAQSRLDDLGGQITAQDQLSKQLRLDTAELESPDRIMRDGQRLEMIPPGPIGFLQPKPDDDVKGQFDPTKETVPVPTTVTTVPAYPGAGSSTTGAGSSSTGTTAKSGVTPTTAAKTSPTTKAPTTTVKPTTTTAKPTTTTTTTTKPKTTATTAAPRG